MRSVRKKISVMFALALAVMMLLAMFPAHITKADDPGTSNEYVEAALAELAGSGTEADPYLIEDYAELVTVAKAVQAGHFFDNEYLAITSDIEIPEDWQPIGCLVDGAKSAGNGVNILPFSGTMDGNGHTLTFAKGTAPLFGYVRSASVQNLKIKGEYINGNGLLQHYVVDYGPSGTYSVAPATIDITNVTIKSGTKIHGSGFLNGSASSSNVVNIRNCLIEEGVLIGVNEDGTSANLFRIGSFAGMFNGSVENSISYADVYGRDYVGGIAGGRGQSAGVFSVTGCAFHGTITATGKNVGGIVAAGYSHATAPNAFGVIIEDCVVDGTVRGTENVGGILGIENIDQLWDNGPGKIRNNQFTGTIEGTANVGGIIGYARSLNKNTIIVNNYYKAGCGTASGIGYVAHVDTNAITFGEHAGVFYFNTENFEQYTEEEWDTIYSYVDAGWENSGRYLKVAIAKPDMNRTDDPLGEDAWRLCRTDEGPVDIFVTDLIVSGEYKTEYLVGEAMSLEGLVLTAAYNDGTTAIIPLDEVSIAGFDSSKPGDILVSLTFEGVTVTIPVQVRAPEGTIHVTVSILGDEKHGAEAGTVHTLAYGNLAEWVPAQDFAASTNDTVWDVLQKVFAENDITCNYNTSIGSVYIAGLTYNGLTLSEKDNGNDSGWMYTLNDAHPGLGVAEQYLEDGDVIVFHYTDNFTAETSTGGVDAVFVQNAIAALPAADDLTLDDKTVVMAAASAYDSLSAEEKAKVTNEQDLRLAVVTIEKLEAEKDAEEKQAAIETLRKQLEDLRQQIEELQKQLSIKEGWNKIDGEWYYYDSNRQMQTGWVKDGGAWYYLDKETGIMKTGWIKDGSTWYFLKSSGAMAASEWCEGYWLSANGSWTYPYKGSWKKNSTGWWFGDTSGWYAKSTTQRINNVYYYFNDAGYWEE
ncbi:MAG: bacterial Ig-like domain-containing protein [Lachnospiraceae bacterium]|nr:bacterial Ig-like domain-containing protein [Lachnospiraceae bacterium]